MGYCTDVQFAAVTESTLVAESEWPSYGRTPYGDRHSPVDQIDAGNVSKLEIAWRFHTGEGAPEFKTRAPTALEVTPLVFRGTMYLSTPLGRVFALDPVTGAQRWVFDPQIDRTTQFGDFANRGVALWLDDAAVVGSRCSLRVFVATIDTRLIALDARDRLAVRGFRSRRNGGAPRWIEKSARVRLRVRGDVSADGGGWRGGRRVGRRRQQPNRRREWRGPWI